jgi:hypothetical protein
MIYDAGKTIITWLIVICVVGFILYHFFSDPVGSAHFVSSVVGGFITGCGKIITFIKAL